MVKEFKTELKETLDLLKNVAETFATKNAEYKVYPSSQLKVSDMVVGGKVEMVGKDSKLEVAPDGNYETEAGDKFTVKSGMIQSIEGETKPAEKPAKKEDEKMDDEEMKAEPKEDAKKKDPDADGDNDADAKGDTDKDAVDMSTEIPAIKDAVAGHDASIAGHDASIAALATAVAEIKEMLQNVIDNTSKDSSEADAFKKEISELKEVVLKLAKMPAQASKTNTNQFYLTDKEEKEKSMLDFAARFASNK